ncbi:MAG TPA: ribosome biogenesis GTPase Der [Bryocella sp.]|nr:ribosome biogenesis GTPase Der [Bryocella sp.]
MAPRRDQKKRMGKKHRQASTRPRKGKAPRTGAQMANVAPKKRKALSSKKAAEAKAARTPRQSPERERSVTLDGARTERDRSVTKGHGSGLRPTGLRPEQPKSESDWEPHGRRDAGGRTGDREVDELAAELDVATSGAAAESVPLVAICGRPNVGKSTLFNRITGTRRSIVGDEPGITRDRIYGEVEWAGRVVRIVDTGGVVPDDEALIPAEIFRQARVALDEADAIVMVVDGRTELAAPDVELARLLIRSAGAGPLGRSLFLAVNKMDSAELEAGAENFRTLGFRHVLPISAEHGIGVADLLDEVWAALPPETVSEEPAENMEGFEEHAEEDEGDAIADASLSADGEEPRERKLRTHGEHVQRETKVAIIGRPNVGKSTLLNALTGTERAIVSPIAGTTRDAVDEVVRRDGHDFRFIDTAGIRRKGKTKLMAEKLSVVMSRKHLEAADVALLMIDATEGVTASDATIGGYAHESGRSVVIVINKWDLMTEVGEDGKRLFDGKAPAEKKVYEQQVRDALKYLDYAPVLFVSAAEGLSARGGGVEEIFKKVELVARERRKRISTGAMNRFLDQIDFQRASVPMNRRVKIYYMTQAAVAPPTFVLFTDRDVKLHFSYERFLANEIRAAFRFIGSPIWFKVRARNKKRAE